jgi:alpha-glucosidase (family GH31 glycosyl hydrolase)
MNYSIAGIMNMNMFGIPMVGADVCGFFGEKVDADMCSRWVQLATFYPFARAHQNLTFKGNDSESSEVYRLPEPQLSMARDSIYDRYQYLRHMYTCLFEVSQWGGSCFDPLFYYYPTDDNLFDQIESSFMVGGALKVSPILNANVTDQFEAYFPAGTWVSMKNFSEIINSTG